jgi:stage II sporulation protein M
VYNGLVVGYVVAVVAAEVGPLTIAVGLLPHGVLEIPALLGAAAVAFRFSHQVLGAALGRRGSVMTRRELRDAVLVFAVALFLIPIAAFVEANVTTELLARMTG